MRAMKGVGIMTIEMTNSQINRVSYSVQLKKTFKNEVIVLFFARYSVSCAKPHVQLL